MNRVIFEEIIPARVTETGVQRIVDILHSLKAQDADAVILGCTELPLVITERNAPLPFLDTTRLQARKAMELACAP